MRDKIIKAGINNLKAYGYPNVTEQNILTDEIYKEFFRSMLEDNIGKDKLADVEIKKLLTEINKEM